MHTNQTLRIPSISWGENQNQDIPLIWVEPRFNSRAKALLLLFATRQLGLRSWLNKRIAAYSAGASGWSAEAHVLAAVRDALVHKIQMPMEQILEILEAQYAENGGARSLAHE